jgi:hypothetical protein
VLPALARCTDFCILAIPSELNVGAGVTRRRSLGWGTALALVLVLLIGIQLGRLPFRYRHSLWQLQGAALGGVIGFVLGQVSARMGRRP